jgi:MarR family transcriptional regulator, organic hydroperoxide resistance regulator
MALMRRDAVQAVMENYPRIYFACHTRHVKDPKTRRQVSAHQASILDHLDWTEPTALLELARHMGVTVSTMSLNVERLVRRGYVRRTRDTEDRRRLRLLLTASGLRLREASSVLEPARVAAMLDELNADELVRALKGLELLARAAERRMARQAEGRPSWRARRTERAARRK